MRAIAEFILRGRIQTLLLIVGGAMLTSLLPIFNHVSGGALALTALRNGPREGIVLALTAALVITVTAFLASFETARIETFLFILVLLVWLPLLVVAQVLRNSRSMGAALAAAAAVSALVVIGFHVMVGDTQTWWRSVMQEMLVPMLEQAHTGLAADEMDKLVDTLAKVMTGILGATVLYTAMTNVFIGRWLQAVVYNPGGFRSEFHAIHLGRWMVGVALVLLVMGNLTGGGLAGASLDLLFLVGAVYSLQGLSLVHGVVAVTQARIAWLVGLYLLMLFALPQVVLVLSAAGFVDSLMDFRARFRKKGVPSQGQDEPPPPGPDGAT
ncbi:MAG: hypothetical protein IT488_06065 [Gammaproteobacteria bacterium]|nr:hypothetical protein [Gammaproteobacteria bacterium]